MYSFGGYFAPSDRIELDQVNAYHVGVGTGLPCESLRATAMTAIGGVIISTLEAEVRAAVHGGMGGARATDDGLSVYAWS